MRTLSHLSWFCALICSSASASTPSAQLLSRLPLRFEENRSVHSPGDAAYVARGGNFHLALRPSESQLEMQGRSVSMSLRGANSHARMEALDRLPGEANYFLGGQTDWKTRVTGYARVRSLDVYPGIDLVFHGEGGRLEYDFIASPHSNPSAIRLEFSGQQSLRIDSNGDLVISTGADEMRWKKPEVYQEGEGKRTPIDGRFVIRKKTVAFEVGTYDRSRTLVIDPTLAYLTYLGGPNNEVGRGIGVDGAGNVYIAGMTASGNLPTVSAAQPNFGGSSVFNPFGDAFVAKFSPAGALVYLTYLGGSGNDAALAIAVDTAGNAYVAGCTTSTNFPTVNPAQTKFGGMGSASIVLTGDAFVAKLNPTGSQLLYSTYLGGSMDDIATAIAIDGSGNAYVAGSTVSQNFPTSTTAYQRNMKGAAGEPIRPNAGQPAWEPGDAFVEKLGPTGQFLQGTLFGGALDDTALTVAVDPSGNVYIGGSTISTDMPTTAGALQKTFGGNDFQNQFFNTGDGFIAEFNPTLSTLMYATYFGGTGDDTIAAIVVDASGNIYMTGSTSTAFFQTKSNVFQPRYGGYYTLPFLIEQSYGDAYVAKINPSQVTPIYLSYLGGSNNDGGTSIAVDSSGNAYVTGFTDSPDFPMAGNPLQSQFGGDGGQGAFILYGDAFLAVVNPTGTALLYSSYLGGNADDEGDALAIDSSGNVYIAGNTLSTNLAVTSGAIQKSFGGFGGELGLIAARGDAFYAKFSGFTAGGPGAPVISSLSPTSATAGGSAFTLTVNGSNFAATSLVQWNGVSLPTTFVSANQLTAQVTANLIMTAGSPNVTVTNSGGIGSNSVTFTISASVGTAAPVITSLNPSSATAGGGAFQLIVNGSNFIAASIVDWNGISLPTTFGNANQLTAQVSASLITAAGSASVMVNNSSVNSNSMTFTISPVGVTSGPALPTLPHFAAQGGVWTTGIFVVNTSATASANFSIAFYDDNGNPVTVPFNPATNTLSGSLPPLGSAYFETITPTAGVALVEGSGRITADSTIVVQSLFRENSSGTYYEAAVPSNAGSKEFEIPFNATIFSATGAQLYTGFAIANLDSANSATITCTAKDQTGTVIANPFIDSNGNNVGPPVLNPLGHWAGFNFPALMTLQGTIDCKSANTNIAAIALRFIGNNAFSSLPVINQPVSNIPVAISALPHFAAQGGVWTTGFMIVNTGLGNPNYSISFYDDGGNSISLPFANGAKSTLTGNLPPFGSAYFETTNAVAPNLIEGWGQITGTGPAVIIQALFRENSSGTYYEASVPSSAGSFEFEIPFDATNFQVTGQPFFTGFAIANLDAVNSANLTCTARTAAGAIIPDAFTGQTGPPPLSPLGHWAGYQFPALTGLRGTIDCTSNTTVAATALRFIGNNAFSSLPVIYK